MVRVLVACDKFKGTATAAAVVAAVQRGVGGAAECECVPLADGGDGFAAVAEGALARGGGGGAVRRVAVRGALDARLRPLERCDVALVGDTAVVESAQLCGVARLGAAERNPLLTSSFGVGQAVRAALLAGARRVLVGVGGTATCDGGVGALQALGARVFLGGALAAQPVCGADLPLLTAVDGAPVRELLRQSGAVLEVVADVLNPLLGANGAAAVFAPQKGATHPAMVSLLERGLEQLVAVAARGGSGAADACAPGSASMGAAGGLSYGLCAFAGACVVLGTDLMTELLRLRACVERADVVVTGEGSFDSQSLSGKLVGGVLQLAAAAGKRCVVLCGTAPDGAAAQLALPRGSCEVRPLTAHFPLDECLARAEHCIEEEARRWARQALAPTASL